MTPGGMLHCRAARLRGREIVLSLPSVGATENLMLAACGAEGTTSICNAAREPEITDLQNFLNACGARVSGAGSTTVVIEGGHKLHGCTYTVMPDRIVAGTYLCAAAAAGGTVLLQGAREQHLATVTAVLREAGCDIVSDSAGIACVCPAQAAGGSACADRTLSWISHRRAGHPDGGAAAQPGSDGV